MNTFNRDMSDAPDEITMVFSRENLHGEAELQRRTDLYNGQQRPGEAVQWFDGYGAVSAIGAGINASYQNLRAGARCLREAGIPSSNTSTSSFRITWLVPRGQVNEAVRVLHQRYLEIPAAPLP